MGERTDPASIERVAEALHDDSCCGDWTGHHDNAKSLWRRRATIALEAALSPPCSECEGKGAFSQDLNCPTCSGSGITTFALVDLAGLKERLHDWLVGRYQFHPDVDEKLREYVSDKEWAEADAVLDFLGGGRQALENP